MLIHAELLISLHQRPRMTIQTNSMHFIRRSSRHLQMVHGSAIHHAQEVIELIVVARIAGGDVVVGEEATLRADESVGVLRKRWVSVSE